MLRIFCDVCRKDFSNEYQKAVDSKNFNFVKIKNFSDPENFFELDLCNDCSTELKKWLQERADNTQKKEEKDEQ